MKAFAPKRSIGPAVAAACRRNRYVRIAAIRQRLQDSWRHMAWESRLAEEQAILRAQGLPVGFEGGSP